MKRLFLAIVLLLCLTSPAWAAGCAGTGACYWVGGTGNWSDTTKWATADGGATTGSVPTSADDVFFTSASSANSYTVTVDATANCRDMTWANPASGSPTLAGNQILKSYGSVILVAGMGFTKTSYFSLEPSSGTKTLTTNGVYITSILAFSADSGQTKQLLDDVNTYWITKAGAGTFDPNGKTVTLSRTGNYSKVEGTLSFYNLTYNGGASKLDNLIVSGNITITNNLTINGNSPINRVLIASDTIGTARVITLTAGAAGLDTTSGNFDLRDIQFNTGGADLDLSGLSGGTVGGGVVSGAGMSGGGTLTTTAAADQIYYKASGNDNWSTVGNWFLGSEGAGGAGRVPLMQDTAYFDEHSFGNDGQTITQDMPRTGSISFNGVGGSHAVGRPYTFTTSNTAEIYGGITLNSYCTLTASTQTYTFMGRGSYGLTSAGKTWEKSITINAPSGTITLQDAITLAAAYGINPYGGTFSTNGNTVTSRGTYTVFPSTLNITNSTIVNFGNTGWQVDATTTLISTNSVIKSTYTGNTVFYGGGKTYNTVWIASAAGSGVFSISGSNTFNQLKDDGTAAHSIKFTKSTTTTVADWQVGTAASRAGNTNVITLDTVDGLGQATIAKSGGGKVRADYLNVNRIIFTPASDWYLGSHSTDGGTNTGGFFKNLAGGIARRFLLLRGGE
jgi:hypothetical protein